MRASTFSAGASSATTSEAPTLRYVRLRLSGQEGVGRRHGHGADTLSTEHVPVETGHQVARAQAPAHGLEGVAPTLRQRPADRGVELFDPTRVRAELLLLPGSADLDPTAEHRMR